MSNIKFKQKPIPENLRRMAAPIERTNLNSTARASLGFESVVGEFNYIPVEDLIPYKNQARRIFDEGELQAMAETIVQYGIKQPLTVIVSDTEDGKYEVVSGERRLRAAKIAKLTRVPCIITGDASQSDAIALIENVHRKDLHPVELGNAFKILLDKDIFSSQTAMASKIFVAEATISEFIQYAYLPGNIQDKILRNNITSRDQLRAILKEYTSGDMEKTEALLNRQGNANKDFSVMRIKKTINGFEHQMSGIKKLNKEEIEYLKEYLLELVCLIEN